VVAGGEAGLGGGGRHLGGQAVDLGGGGRDHDGMVPVGGSSEVDEGLAVQGVDVDDCLALGGGQGRTWGIQASIVRPSRRATSMMGVESSTFH